MTDRLQATCPYCGQHNGCSEALPRGLLERSILRALGFRPYRCIDCGHHRTLFVGLGRKPVAEIEPTQEPPSSTATAPLVPKEDFQTLIQEFQRQEESLFQPQDKASDADERLPWKNDG